MSKEYVSQREFGRRMGVSHVWVNRQCRHGNIPYDAEKGIPFHDGVLAFEATKVAGAEGSRAYHAEQRAKRARGEIVGPNGKTRTRTPRKSTPAVKLVDEDDDTDSGPLTAADAARVGMQYNKARLAEKTYQARLRELEYKRMRRELIPIEEVQADARATGSHVRGLLLALPGRAAARCEGVSAREIEQILREEINTALTELQKSVFGAGEYDGE